MKTLQEQLEAERRSPVPDLMLIRVLEQRIAEQDKVPAEVKLGFWDRIRLFFAG